MPSSRGGWDEGAEVNIHKLKLGLKMNDLSKQERRAMSEKKLTVFEKNTAELAILLHQTDDAMRKVLTRGEGSPAEISTLKNCMERLNQYTAERRLEKDYKMLQNSISQGESAVETLQQALKEKETDLKSQYRLLSKLKEKIGTDHSNRDLIERVEQLQQLIVPGVDKTGEILALEKELTQMIQQRRKQLQRENERKQLVSYLFVIVLYEQRFGACVLANPNVIMWSKLAKEWGIPATPEADRVSVFDFLGKQKLQPAARQIYDGLCAVMNTPEEKHYDFSIKENRRELKRESIEKLKKITRFEALCHEALHEDSEQYRELMAAQNALLSNNAEGMSLGELQEKLKNLQKASQKYMEKQVEIGGICGTPRREARLVYAAALLNFAQKFGLQLCEAMKYRDIDTLELPGDLAKDYVKNSLAAIDLMVKEQVGVDLTKKNEPELAGKLVLDNNR